MSWTVYEHWSPSGKVYVGITSQSIKVRWQNGNGYIKCKTFYRAIRKYGWENMKHVIVSSNLGEKTAKNMEKDLICMKIVEKNPYIENKQQRFIEIVE